MADKNEKRARTGSLTTTTTETTTEVLQPEEERIIRMLHGMGEPDEAKLTFVETQDEEVNLRLKMLEAALLAQMHGQGPLAEEGGSAKEKILTHLRRIEDE